MSYREASRPSIGEYGGDGTVAPRDRVPAVTGRLRGMGLPDAVRARLLRARRRECLLALRAARDPRRHGRRTRRRRTRPRGCGRCWMAWLRVLLAGARDANKQPAPVPGRWRPAPGPPALAALSARPCGRTRRRWPLLAASASPTPHGRPDTADARPAT